MIGHEETAKRDASPSLHDCKEHFHGYCTFQRWHVHRLRRVG